MKKKRKYKKNKKRLILIILAIIIILVCGLAIAYINRNNNVIKLPNIEQGKKPEVEEPKRLKIIDPDSKTRNIAVMINNIKAVWGYQSGIQDAYIVYEIIAEGGISRLMAVFKDQDTERIGSVRSSRIYYLDYVLENDAIYMHVGGSKEALRDIGTLNIASINGYGIFRDKTLGLKYEHTAFTSMANIQEQVAKRKFRTTTETKNLLNYSVEEIDLSKLEGSTPANDVFISYSSSKSTRFKYDAEKKVYMRFQNDLPHTDYVTKEQYTVKNIITYQVKNSSYDSYGRQKLDNIGEGTGYYITDGYAVPIIWEKKNRGSQTIYKYLNGEEITVNDGNTHIEIQPLNRKLTLN